MAVDPVSPSESSRIPVLGALVLAPSLVGDAIASSLKTLANATGSRASALFTPNGSAGAGEIWHFEADLPEDLRTAMRMRALAALERGMPPTTPGPPIFLLRAAGRVQGVLCLGAPQAPDVERLPEGPLAGVLETLGWQAATYHELIHAQSIRAQYDRWFRHLDEQVRVLDRERQKFAAIVHRTDALVFVTDPSRTILWTNSTLASQQPREGEGWIGRCCDAVCASFHDATHARPSRCEDCPVAQALEHNHVVHREFRRSEQGQNHSLYLSALPIKGLDGRPTEAMVMVQDLSGLESLRQSESRYRLLFERSAKAILLVDPATHRILLANPMASRATGFSGTELLNLTLPGLHSESEWRRLEPVYAAGLREGLGNQECRIKARDGSELHALLSGTPYDLDGLEVLMLEYLDLTEHKQVHAALQRLEERLRAVVANTPIVLFAIDRDGTFTMSEGRGLRQLDLEPGQVVGLSVFEVYKDYPRIVAAVRRALAGEEFTEVTEFGRLGFETRYTPVRDPNGEVTGLIGVATDVTERRTLEERLRHAQRMEAIGRLAGGVAHDFNNLLSAILGHSELALARVEPGHPMRRSIEEIQKAGTRGSLLTRQLLAFSRKDVLTPAVVDLNVVVLQIEAMLRRLIGEDIEVTVVPSPKPAAVYADRGQLEQIVMNLAVNARDAMPRGGCLTIGVENVKLDGAYTQQHADVSPGAYVMLSVADNGCGMDAETLAHAFEPFYTTKGPGKGTGLGLSTVYGIAQQNHGHVSVYSEPGLGSTFKVYFPQVGAPAATAEPVEEQAGSARGVETVLLVEDEDPVRSVTREVLESNGYRVIEARNGAEGLGMAAAHEGVIDILVTDVVMPVMGGGELAQRLVAQRPGLRVLYVSGYTDDAVVRHGVLEKSSAFMQKPYALSALVRKVREMLDEEAPPRASDRAAA